MPAGVYQRSPEQLIRLQELRIKANAARRLQRKTHCKRGHELNDENLYIYPGKRSCKICLLNQGKRRRQELKGTTHARVVQRRKSLRRSRWTFEQYEKVFS